MRCCPLSEQAHQHDFARSMYRCTMRHGRRPTWTLRMHAKFHACACLYTSIYVSDKTPYDDKGCNGLCPAPSGSPPMAYGRWPQPATRGVRPMARDLLCLARTPGSPQKRSRALPTRSQVYIRADGHVHRHVKKKTVLVLRHVHGRVCIRMRMHVHTHACTHACAHVPYTSLLTCP